MDPGATKLPPGVVASVDGSLITTGELAAELQRNRGLAGSSNVRQEALDALIERRSLLRRARAEGMLDEPDMAAAIDRLVVAEYLRRHLPEGDPEPDEAAIREYYEANLDEFTEPQAIRIGVLVAPEEGETARHLRQEAEHLDEAGFRQLVAQHSLDQPTRYRGGDAGWIRENDRHPRWDSAVMTAAWKLAEVGEVAPLVASGGRAHVIRLLARQPEDRRPLAEVRDGIRHALGRRLARQRQEEFYQQLRAGVRIEINQPALQSVPVPQVITGVAPPAAGPR